jgi:hypothetical protein
MGTLIGVPVEIAIAYVGFLVLLAYVLDLVD